MRSYEVVVINGFKNEESAQQIIEGFRAYYNFIRKHQSLKGRTPAEACGITVGGKNKWRTLIQNASLPKN